MVRSDSGVSDRYGARTEHRAVAAVDPAKSERGNHELHQEQPGREDDEEDAQPWGGVNPKNNSNNQPDYAYANADEPADRRAVTGPCHFHELGKKDFILQLHIKVRILAQPGGCATKLWCQKEG